MKFEKIEIKNYKSIKDISFKIEKYGDSYMAVLLGKNETGKSNILEAMRFLGGPINAPVDFSSIVNRDNRETVSCSFKMKCDSDDELGYRKALSEAHLNISPSAINFIKVSYVVKEVYIEERNPRFSQKWTFNLMKTEFESLLYEERTQEIITMADVEGARSEYKRLTHKILQERIQPVLEEYFSIHEPKVFFWRASENPLINDPIPLKNFSVSPGGYSALRNIFYLCGYDTDEKIKTEIDKLKINPDSKRNLAKELEDKTTEYINKSWPEHEIVITVTIEGKPLEQMNIEVKVQDKGNDDDFYQMIERSQGFQQFISIILSLPFLNHKEEIKNQLILIDEPETHLHPSAVRDLRNKLLEIGKNNYLFVATHSPFIIDKNFEKRHFLVTKIEGKETKIKRIEAENIYDDEVLDVAFGINVIKDFLSPEKVFVEGASDKKLIYKALHQVEPESKIRISNGNGSNLPDKASKFASNEIYPVVITDDDKEGRRMKDEIIKELKDDGFTADNVFTIRDLNGNITKGGTIEDTLPKGYVRSKINKILRKEKITEMSSEELDDNKPFMYQVRVFLNKNIPEDNMEKKKKGDKVEYILKRIKTKISEDYDKEKAERLYKLAQEISKKVEKNIQK